MSQIVHFKLLGIHFCSDALHQVRAIEFRHLQGREENDQALHIGGRFLHVVFCCGEDHLPQGVVLGRDQAVSCEHD